MSAAPIPALFDPARVLPAALLRGLNHVLRQQEWARTRLAMHAGKSVCIGLEGTPGALTALIGADGLLQPLFDDSDAEADPDTRAAAPPSAMLLVRSSIDAAFALVREGPTGVQRHLRVEGDVMLAATLGELAQHLRWDVEEDLSALVGDVAAHRLHGLASSALRQIGSLFGRAGTSAQQFVESGRAPVVDGTTARALGDELAALDRRVHALEQRVERLGAAASGPGAAASGPGAAASGLGAAPAGPGAAAAGLSAAAAGS